MDGLPGAHAGLFGHMQLEMKQKALWCCCASVPARMGPIMQPLPGGEQPITAAAGSLRLQGGQQVLSVSCGDEKAMCEFLLVAFPFLLSYLCTA